MADAFRQSEDWLGGSYQGLPLSIHCRIDLLLSSRDRIKKDGKQMEVRLRLGVLTTLASVSTSRIDEVSGVSSHETTTQMLAFMFLQH